MRAAGDGPHGRRLRALIVILWRAGLRVRRSRAASAERHCLVVAAIESEYGPDDGPGAA
jgi:hypothetical protein